MASFTLFILILKIVKKGGKNGKSRSRLSREDRTGHIGNGYSYGTEMLTSRYVVYRSEYRRVGVQHL